MNTHSRNLFKMSANNIQNGVHNGRSLNCVQLPIADSVGFLSLNQPYLFSMIFIKFYFEKVALTMQIHELLKQLSFGQSAMSTAYKYHEFNRNYTLFKTDFIITTALRLIKYDKH